MCLLKRAETTDSPSGTSYKPAFSSLTKEEQRVTEDFLKEVLQGPLKSILPGHILQKQGDMIALVPRDVPLPPHHVYLAGVTLGMVQKGRFTPHHHLFSALGKYFKNQLPLACDSADTLAYLHGETVKTTLPNGYAVVTIYGAPLGGVKVVDGVAKNHYPKGLRIP